MLEKIKNLLEKSFSIPLSQTGRDMVDRLNPGEKILLWGLIVFLIFGAGWTLKNLSDALMVTIPAKGGVLSEGVVGSPGFLNPLIATRDSDRLLTTLVYSGLVKSSAEGGLVPDLAESYSISEDGLSYSFLIKQDAVFHDGKPVTAEDVAFTITRAVDQSVKSPKRANWEGVTVQVVNDREIKFILRQPYYPFLENATLGILPKHIWNSIDSEQFPFSQYNVYPVGSGPYRVARVEKDENGVATLYELNSFKNYVGGAPYIDTINVKFYTNEEELIKAYRVGSVEILSTVSPKGASELEKKGVKIEHTPLPRVFGVFFNQNHNPVLANKEVRTALDTSLDKELIIKEVLQGYGTIANSPIPNGLVTENDSANSESKNAATLTGTAATTTPERILKARALLEKSGWKQNAAGIYEKTVKKQKIPLSFTIATGNADELKAAAAIIKDEWKKLGANVDIKVYEQGDLNQNIIRPRKYDALLFGEIVGRDLDLFAFWHSSQRNDPGLNIALYANITADQLLENARAESDQDKRLADYRKFVEEVRDDAPAVFTYVPDLIYILPEKIKGVEVGNVNTPSEIFSNLNEWYIETKKVWPFATGK